MFIESLILFPRIRFRIPVKFAIMGRWVLTRFGRSGLVWLGLGLVGSGVPGLVSNFPSGERVWSPLGVG